ncbi:Ig-like domain-containing protein [Candidatus Bipolaricaulota bacterium]
MRRQKLTLKGTWSSATSPIQRSSAAETERRVEPRVDPGDTRRVIGAKHIVRIGLAIMLIAVTVSLISTVGKAQSYADVVVSGFGFPCGDDVNGAYHYSFIQNGKPKYRLDMSGYLWGIAWTSQQEWIIFVLYVSGEYEVIATNSADTSLPPADGWVGDYCSAAAVVLSGGVSTTHTLTISTVGQGTISPSSGEYEADTSVELTANPSTNWSFSGWSGDLSGTTNPQSVTMDGDKSVTATFIDVTVPVISGLDLPDTEQSVNEACTITIPYSATVTDNYCVEAGSVNVVVEFVDPFNKATLTAPPASIVNSGGGSPNDTVSVSGSFTASNLTGGPVQVQVRIDGTDCNGNVAVQASDMVTIIDSTAPVITWGIELPESPQYVDPTLCTITFPIQATVTDNCCILAENVSADITLGENSTLIHAVTATQVGSAVVVAGSITVSNLDGCLEGLSIAIDATDCFGNAALQLTDSVEIYDNTAPVTYDLVVDDQVLIDADSCNASVTFSARVVDNCCITPENVTVSVILPTDNATLSNIVINRTQNELGWIDVTGSADVSCLRSCPARVEVHVEATDCCGNAAIPVTSTETEGLIYDVTAPVAVNDPVRFEDRSGSDNIPVLPCDFGLYRLLIPMDTATEIDVIHNDSDNCVSGCYRNALQISDISQSPKHGRARISPDRTSILYSPFPSYTGPDGFSYLVIDGCGNVSEEAAALVEVVAYPLMNDAYFLPCNETAFTFLVGAIDVWAKYAGLSTAQPLFSIVTLPLHGVLRADLGDVSVLLNESAGEETIVAEISITYVPAVGFSSHDVMSLRVTDPLGDSDDAVIDLYLVRCTNTPAAMEPLLLDQGATLELILPATFVSIDEAPPGDTVTLILRTSEEDYASTLTLSEDEATSGHLLSVDTTVLPSGEYVLTIPLRNGETVEMIIEVAAGEGD